jgi:hypothetical protein
MKPLFEDGANEQQVDDLKGEARAREDGRDPPGKMCRANEKRRTVGRCAAVSMTFSALVIAHHGPAVTGSATAEFDHFLASRHGNLRIAFAGIAAGIGDIARLSCDCTADRHIRHACSPIDIGDAVDLVSAHARFSKGAGSGNCEACGDNKFGRVHGDFSPIMNN